MRTFFLIVCFSMLTGLLLANVPSTDAIIYDPVVIRFFQVLNILIFGLVSFVLCLVAMIIRSKKLKLIGLIFLALFTLFSLFGLLKMATHQPETERLYTVFQIEFFMIIACGVFLLIKRSPKMNGSTRSMPNNDSPDNPFTRINHKTDF